MLSAAHGEVARLVRRAGTISRRDISRSTGMSRPAVLTALDTLIRLGFVREVGSGSSTGGRPPALVCFEARAAYAVGVELGASGVELAVTDLTVEVVAHTTARIDVEDGPGIVLDGIEKLIRSALGDAGIDPQQVCGVGIGLPGPVDRNRVRQVSPPLLRGWDDYPVTTDLTQRLGRPVFADNDVNLRALGEAAGGVDVADFLYVKLGSGIGCGIVSGGRLYRGNNGSAGDIGHIANSASTQRCLCGNTGCLEAIAGGYALALAAQELADSGRSPALAALARSQVRNTAVELGAALRGGDVAALELVRTAGTAVGEVLAGLVDFFNPGLIILGGGVLDVGDVLISSIREAVYRRSRPSATRDLSVVIGALGSRAGVIGAASLVLDQLYHLRPIGANAR